MLVAADHAYNQSNVGDHHAAASLARLISSSALSSAMRPMARMCWLSASQSPLGRFCGAGIGWASEGVLVNGNGYFYGWVFGGGIYQLEYVIAVIREADLCQER